MRSHNLGPFLRLSNAICGHQEKLATGQAGVSEPLLERIGVEVKKFVSVFVFPGFADQIKSFGYAHLVSRILARFSSNSTKLRVPSPAVREPWSRYLMPGMPN